MPDFVFYGGDLAQLGQAKELEMGAQILKNLKAPLRMMVGEHDWFLFNQLAANLSDQFIAESPLGIFSTLLHFIAIVL